MRNVRSYLSAQDVEQAQSYAYPRLNTTTGLTYGSRYKRRYGTASTARPVPAIETFKPVSKHATGSQNSTTHLL